jgi:hypothetical protein
MTIAKNTIKTGFKLIWGVQIPKEGRKILFLSNPQDILSSHYSFNQGVYNLKTVVEAFKVVLKDKPDLHLIVKLHPMAPKEKDNIPAYKEVLNKSGLKNKISVFI